MKIYFAGSIRGGRDDAELYSELIRYLEENYGKVLSEHIGYKNLIEGIPTVANKLTDNEIHDKDIDWLEVADVVIAEVTNPSLGVGYEIGRVYNMNKPILCLYNLSGNKKLSAMISGSDKVRVVKYLTLEEAKLGIDDFLNLNKILVK